MSILPKSHATLCASEFDPSKARKKGGQQKLKVGGDAAKPWCPFLESWRGGTCSYSLAHNLFLEMFAEIPTISFRRQYQRRCQPQIFKKILPAASDLRAPRLPRRTAPHPSRGARCAAPAKKNKNTHSITLLPLSQSTARSMSQSGQGPPYHWSRRSGHIRLKASIVETTSL